MEITMPPTTKIKQPSGRTPNYTPEYYMMMAKRVVNEGLTYREAGKAFKCAHGTVSHWVKLYKNGQLPERIRKNESRKKSADDLLMYRMERYVKQLKEEIAELYLENALLKKAQIYSQQMKKLNTSVITSANLDQFKEDAE